MNYLEEAINCSLYTDQIFYEEILEHLDVERDFMISCLENNIILEAEAPANENKTNWLQNIKNAIKKIFDKFIETVQNLFKSDEKWINDNIDKLKNLNFNGLNVNVLPYWTLDTNEIFNVLNSLQKEINNIQIGDKRLKNLQSREQVEKYGEFKKYTRRNGTFADGIKSYFKVGETNEPKAVPLSGNELKRICVSEMSKYVVAYNSTIASSLRSSYNNFDKMLSNIDRKLKQNRPVGESFCVIENSYYSDTELSLCENFNILFEADNDNKTTNNDNKPVLNKVEDTSKNTNTDTSTGQNEKNVTKEGNTEYYNYLKNAIQLNQIAIAAALTACEERYRAYMTILRGVVAARSK